MELNELHVCDAAAGAPSYRDSVTCRHVRVTRVEVDLACTTSGEDGCSSGDGNHSIRIAIQNICAQAAIMSQSQFLTGHEIYRNVILEHVDVHVIAHMLLQGRRTGTAGSVVGVDYAPMAMSPLTCEVVLRFVVLI